MARKIEVEIVGDARSFQRSLGRASSSASRLGKVLGGAGRAALYGGAAVAGTALVGLGLAARAGFKELEASTRVAAQTNAVLKSTGRVANVSAKQVDNLASSLMAKSGVDDEVVKSGENMLLTFTRVRNQVGKNNDIFNQATELTLDLSVAMGRDMTDSAIMVGKALNDPERGLTALRRVGVAFSDSQQELVKRLVDTGHTMEAQKLILAELRKEFGGSAAAAGKTFGGQLDILRESFKNLAAEGIRPLIPVLLSVTQWVTQHLPEIRQVFRTVFGAIGSIVGGVTSRIQAHSGQIRSAFNSVRAFVLGTLLPAFARLRDFVIARVRDLVGYFQAHRADLTEVWRNVVATVSNVIAIFRRMWPTVRSAITRVLPLLVDLSRAIATVSGWASSAASSVARLDSAIRSLSSSGGGGLLDIIPGGNTSLIDILPRQHGGPVSRSRPYLVGERGPELFVPGAGGRIVANGGGGSMGSVNVIVVGGDRQAIRYFESLFGRHAKRNGG